MRGLLWILVLYAWFAVAALVVFIVFKAGQTVGTWLGRRTQHQRGRLRG